MLVVYQCIKMSKLELFIALFLATTMVYATSTNSKTSSWQTLSGDAPLVIARGGFSGVFPSSSDSSYKLALSTSLSNTILWCDVQLTKDAVGICLPDLRLDNATNLPYLERDGSRMYLVNGEPMRGWFSIDYTLKELQKVILIQDNNARGHIFEGNLFRILTVENVAQLKPEGLWLNAQHDEFFMQRNFSMRSYLLSVSKNVIVSYISSPEVDFLRSIFAGFSQTKTKLVFRFLEAEKMEPSTNQSYGSLVNNLTFFKTFASGILVPKRYIWNMDSRQYLQGHTSLVSDAHKEGLEVFASDFANDQPLSYNYSSDPAVREILSFVDNGEFSVDGVLSDFPITPSEAIDCFSHIGPNNSGKATPKIVSHNGASGVYPGSTDLAYNQAIEDGVDYLDCFVQMTRDAIPICLSSMNLMDASDIVQSPFNNLAITVPEIQKYPGIFSFNLTWKDIQSLRPAMSITIPGAALYQNPAYKNAGNFVSLDDFLTIAKKKPLTGILIRVENAAYLAERKGLGIVDAVLEALNKSGYNNLTTQEVIIQSTHEAVLKKFKEQSSYKRMYRVDKAIRSVDDSAIEEIKSFATSVAINKESVFTRNIVFLTGATDVVEKLHAFNLSVYVYVFKNEFLLQAWDYFSDPTVEINSFATGNGTAIDGIITDFPGTAAVYRKNRCLDMADRPVYMRPVSPGGLMQHVTPIYRPAPMTPNPILGEGDVAEPPLPPVSKATLASHTGSASLPTSLCPRCHIFMCSLCILLLL